MYTLEGYNWPSAFDVACGDRIEAVPPGAVVDLSPFTVSDVDKVIWCEEGENEGANWRAVVLLKDGRYATVNAGCDYSGFG